jgi:hypothetical protein
MCNVSHCASLCRGGAGGAGGGDADGVGDVREPRHTRIGSTRARETRRRPASSVCTFSHVSSAVWAWLRVSKALTASHHGASV